MNNLELISGLGKIIVFLMLLFSVFLLSARSKNRLQNRLFSAFLLITALDISGLFIGGFFEFNPNLKIIKTASSLLQMPLYFIYVVSICYSDFKLKPKHLVHAILFIVAIPFLKLTSYSEKSLFYFRIVAEIQYFAYILAVFYVLKRYKVIYLENYSVSDYTGWKWLLQMTLFFCFAHIFVLLKLGAIFLETDAFYIQLFYLLISFSALTIICWFVLKALHNPQLFTGVKVHLVPIESTIKNSRIKQEIDPIILKSKERLSNYMKKEKPYLDFDLSLEKLSSNFGMAEKDLSILINHHLGKHFFDFINEYRIAEAQKILENPNNKKLTILEVLYMVGFNSKSSFYTAFKKITNQTPTEFRKSALTLKTV